MDGSLALECNEEMTQFQAFADIFAALCSKFEIIKLPDAANFCSRDDLVRDSRKIGKFTFNISPEDFDRLLIAESDAYRGYRNYKGSGSILLLANPHLEAFKEGVICAFPVVAMEDNQVMLRISGCNTTELLSTQLSYLITQHLPPEAYQHSTKRYGHWGAEITKCISSDDTSLLIAALGCFSDNGQAICQQSMEGFDILPIREESRAWLHEVDASNLTIYRLLGVASPEELTQLKSLEIPAEIYLSQLAKLIKSYLSEYEPGGSRGLGSDYYSESDDLHCKELKTNLSNIAMILSNIEKSKQAQPVLQEPGTTTESIPFAFFKPSSQTLNPITTLTISPSIPVIL